MHPHRIPLKQIIHQLRPRRPPNSSVATPSSRLFTSRTPLRIITRTNPKRPFVPFLSRSLRHKDAFHISRLISSDTKAYLKRQAKIFLWLQLAIWTICTGGAIGYTLLLDDWMDKLYPAPKEWGYLERRAWNRAHREIDTDGEGVISDSGMIASEWRALILMLEGLDEDSWFGFSFAPSKQPEVREQYDWDRSVPGFDNVAEMLRLPGSKYYDSKIGYDVTQKSEEWRRGYFEAMMGHAKGCERQFGNLGTNAPIAWPREFVFSDENPYPKQLPPQVKLERPHIDDCWDAFDNPELIYTRILTTHGFNRIQRMQAGIAYAQWLSFTGDNAYAEKMFHWALKLACEGTDKADQIINSKTAIIKPNAPYVTPNILSVATSLASHYARANEPTRALNIYLSVLRARQNASEAPLMRQYKETGPDFSLKTPDSLLRFILNIPYRAPYPPPPTNGDEPFERSKSGECDEAALKTWVGEILFAKTSQRKQGLEWTSDAVQVVEARRQDPKLDDATKKACTQCLETGYDNWLDMVRRLVEEQKGQKPVSETAQPRFFSRFWRSSPAASDPLMDGTDWEKEYQALDRRYAKYKGKKIDHQIASAQKKMSKTFVV